VKCVLNDGVEKITYIGVIFKYNRFFAFIKIVGWFFFDGLEIPHR
jgi:hypothetical protein